MSDQSRDDDSAHSTPERAPEREMGRRETLQLATLAAALGAGLSVSLHADEASAADAPQKVAAETRFHIKFYQVQHKGDPVLVHTAGIPDDVSKKLLEGAGLVQWKYYSKETVLGAGQVQLKAEQKQAAPVVKLPVDLNQQQRKP